MRVLTLVLVSMLVCGAVLAADPAEEVRQAEIAFAKAFADRDADRFFAMVADDANFLGPRQTLVGKPAVITGWMPMLKEGKAGFSWAPDRVVVNAAGDLGLSTGPVHGADGKLIGAYSSVWQRQADGSWRVIFDGPGAPPPCPPK